MIAVRRSTTLADARASSRSRESRESVVRVGADDSIGGRVVSSLVTIAVVAVVVGAAVVALAYAAKGA